MLPGINWILSRPNVKLFYGGSRAAFSSGLISPTTKVGLNKESSPSEDSTERSFCCGWWEHRLLNSRV